MGKKGINKVKTENKRMSNQKKILSLQGLRAVMFFLIFFFHSDLYLDGYDLFNKFLIGGVPCRICILCTFRFCYRLESMSLT